MRMTSTCTVAAVAVVLLWTAGAQGVRAQQALFRGGIDVVYFTLTVTDGGGRFLTDLTQEDFTVYDNGVRQDILSFSSERVPVSLGVLLDVSGSMTEAKTATARAAIERFAFDLLAPDDELFLAEFSASARMLQSWTRDRALFRAAVARANRGRPEFGTSLFDAAGSVIVAAATGAHTKKALVIISDGIDTSSRTPVREVQDRIRQSEVLVYALGVNDRDNGGGGVDARALRRLTDDTGGRTEIVRGFEGLDEATTRLADELNQQYLIGYAAPARDGRWHEIKVDVSRRGAQVRARTGYVAS